MLKKVSTLLLFLFCTLGLVAQEAVTIERVDFNSLKDDWLQMEIELACNGNPNPEARSSRYVEKIKVKAYVVFTVDQKERKFDFYTSEVEVALLKQGDDANVYFYLPGLIMERDKWPTTPDFYFVELTVDGEVQPTQKRGLSSSITNESILSSMKSLAVAEAEKNKNLLMPLYFVPSEFVGRISKVPAFIRREPAE